MFEAAELGRKISKRDFQDRLSSLRVELLNMQFGLKDADFPVIVVIAGDDRSGTNDALNLMNAWLDARYLLTNAYGPRSDEERERPPFWRYWRALPPKGRIGIFHGSWTWEVILQRFDAAIDELTMLHSINNINSFERCMVDDGAILLKFWLHLPKSIFKQRIREWQKDPEQSWRINQVDEWMFNNYRKSISTIENVLRRTSKGETQWNIVESSDNRYANLRIAETILERVNKRLKENENKPSESSGSSFPSALDNQTTILDKIDLNVSLPKDQYEHSLREWQSKLSRLARAAYEAGRSSVLVFEGWDAAGKGGVIRRLTAAMSAATYRVIRISAPSAEERRHHYLWRFWRYMPRAGNVAIFDRSWYGRVLVERIESFATEREYRRGYSEINHFEEQLWRHGIVLSKFWLHINREEQSRRFEARRNTPYKKHKLSDEDIRNRNRWEDYKRAANDMIERTSTDYAKWHIIPANDKRHARIQVLQIVCSMLEEALEGKDA